jgi:hypothetical protein
MVWVTKSILFCLFFEAVSGASQLRLAASKLHEIVDNRRQSFRKRAAAVLDPTLAAAGLDPRRPFQENSTKPSRLACGFTEQVSWRTDKSEECPAVCPFFAQNRADDEHCTFLCVPGNDCAKWNPNKPIPDKIKGTSTCRGPRVEFCSEANLDGSDTCKVCMSGYSLSDKDGLCYFEYWNTIMTGLVLLGLFLGFVVFWVAQMFCREPVNEECLKQGEAFRSRSKVINREDGHHSPYPLNTKLWKKEIAGPGMLLHFRFQIFFIVWPLFVACVWMMIALVDWEVLTTIGTKRFGTPRQNCILVMWGYEKQQSLMWTKVLFLAIVYVVSFVSFLLFGVSQLRCYNEMSAEEKTMQDFALELKGLPEITGADANAEKELQRQLEEAFKPVCENGLVGVTIAWKYAEQEDDIMRFCYRDLYRRETAYHLEKKNGKAPTSEEVEHKLKSEEDKCSGWEEDKPKWMPMSLYNKEREWCCPIEELERSRKQTEADESEEATAMLKEIAASDSAYIVFDTAEEKTAALEYVKENPVKLDSSKFSLASVDEKSEKEEVTFVAVVNEPANINWQCFVDDVHHSPYAMLGRFAKGFFTVYLPALTIWFFFFYVPYAYSLLNFNYDNGAELPGWYGMVFTIIVCGGNTTMYFVCDMCCDIIGFKFKDTKQVVYTLMYLCACLINVVLDLVVTYQLGLYVMTGLDFRNIKGVRLKNIENFNEQFETYAMQRFLGENVFIYCWPSTFFICFIIEPIVTIMVPYYLGRTICRTHREVRGVCAEAYLLAFEFDLGRYADILLNVFLGILIFYFPGGFLWRLFFFMSFSHCYIYVFDHWKVLNVIPSLKIVSNTVDWYAQVVMAGCCSLILACLVFKANCESYAGYCIMDMRIVPLCTIAGFTHLVVHLALLCYVVPKFGGEFDEGCPGMKYESVAERESRTWFSSNPVHCLRSKYIHQHKMPCRLAYWGKEHLLEVNPEIGCFFKGEEAEAEEFDLRHSFSALRKSISGSTI